MTFSFKKHFGLDCQHQKIVKAKKGLWQCVECKRYYALNLYMSEVHP